jgi:quercetin dioxygenase-like cupin family protein
MGWQRQGEEEHVARVGETVTFAPGEVHRFWNAGNEELVCSGHVRPPDNLEYFLVFPAVVAVGRLRGLHRRFADAPEPVSRART